MSVEFVAIICPVTDDDLGALPTVSVLTTPPEESHVCPFEYFDLELFPGLFIGDKIFRFFLNDSSSSN
jgi:hypothetical protein